MPDQNISQLPEATTITNPDNVLMLTYVTDAPLGSRTQKAKSSLFINKAVSSAVGSLSIVTTSNGVALTSAGVTIADIVKFGNGLVFNNVTKTVAIDTQVVAQQQTTNSATTTLASPKAFTVPLAPISTYSGSLDPSYSDAWLTANEFNPDGVPNTYSWYSNAAQQGWMNLPPLDYSAVSVWGQIYTYGGYTPTGSNTRVQIRNIETWIKSIATNVWTKVQFSTVPTGSSFVSDFVNESSVAASAKDESANGGGISVVSGNGYNYHFWSGARGVINPIDIAAVYSKFDARLVLDKSSGTDDRASSKYIASAGADYWRNSTSVWASDWSNNGSVVGGIFKRVDNNWKAFSCSTIPVVQMTANPPTLDWIRATVATPADDTTIVISNGYQWRDQPGTSNVQAKSINTPYWTTFRISAAEIFASGNRIYIGDSSGNRYSCADSEIWSANGASFLANIVTVSAYNTAKSSSSRVITYSTVPTPVTPPPTTSGDTATLYFFF